VTRPRARARALTVGAGIVAAYLAAVLFTAAVRHDGARPLFDGFAPAPSYRFVDPPPFFASGNTPPGDVTRSIALGRAGTAAAGVSTPDGQFVIDLARGAIASRAGATSVAVTITPIAPKQLAAVPDGRPNGNAYRVDMRYEPSGEPVTAFARPGTLLIETPELASAVLRSPAGTAWKPIPARSVGSNGLSMSATLAAPGYYLATTTLPELEAAATSTSSHTSSIILGVVIAIVALGLFGIAFLVLRRRKPPSPTD
jgi:hypothetical protein